ECTAIVELWSMTAPLPFRYLLRELTDLLSEYLGLQVPFLAPEFQCQPGQILHCLQSLVARHIWDQWQCRHCGGLAWAAWYGEKTRQPSSIPMPAAGSTWHSMTTLRQL